MKPLDITTMPNLSMIAWGARNIRRALHRLMDWPEWVAEVEGDLDRAEFELTQALEAVRATRARIEELRNAA